jgi:hypothetical protein
MANNLPSLPLEYVYKEKEKKVFIRSILTAPQPVDYQSTQSAAKLHEIEYNSPGSSLVDERDTKIIDNVILPASADTTAKKEVEVRKVITADLGATGLYTVKCTWPNADGSKGSATSTISQSGNIKITYYKILFYLRPFVELSHFDRRFLSILPLS